MKTDARIKKRENETLYILKVWATFSVIAIHFGFLGQIGVFYKVLARFAVPLFFMISGFYSFSISEEKLKKRIKCIDNFQYKFLFFTGCFSSINTRKYKSCI